MMLVSIPTEVKMNPRSYHSNKVLLNEHLAIGLHVKIVRSCSPRSCILLQKAIYNLHLIYFKLTYICRHILLFYRIITHDSSSNYSLEFPDHDHDNIVLHD